jgi:hypothetical protein
MAPPAFLLDEQIGFDGSEFPSRDTYRDLAPGSDVDVFSKI